MIAHELVHVQQHASRLWWLELLSWLTITGPGFLTLLLDFAAMEFQADEVTHRWTKDRSAALKALEYFQESQSVNISSGEGRLSDAIRHLRRPGPTRFRTAFFVFGASQPSEESVSLQDRADRIAAYAIQVQGDR